MEALTTSWRLRWAALDAWQRLAVVLWFILVTASCGRGLLYHLPRHTGVYVAYADAGRHWLAGENVYPDEFGWNTFPYSPLVAAALVPFGVLPGPLGSALWRLALALLCLLALARWSRLAFRPGLSPTQRTGIFLLVLPLTAPTLVNGQAGALVLSLLLLALADAAEERWNRASLFAALAGMVKVYPFAIGLLLALLSPRRCAGRFAVAVLTCLAVPFLLQRPDYVVEQYANWLRFLPKTAQHAWFLTEAGRDVNLLLRVYVHPLSVPAYRAVQIAVALAVAGLCLAGRRAGWPHHQLLARLFGLAACWMTVFGPGPESFVYILLGPTLAALLLDTGRGRLSWAVLWASWGIFTVASAAVWFPWGRNLHEWGPHPFAGLLLLGCLLTDVFQGLRGGRGAALPQPLAQPARAA